MHRVLAEAPVRAHELPPRSIRNPASGTVSLQVGRTGESWTPYRRWERAALDPLDGYFRSQRSGRSFTQVILGARCALDANTSLNVELRRSRESAATQFDETGALVDVDAASYRRAQLQYSIAFRSTQHEVRSRGVTRAGAGGFARRSRR